MKNIVLISKLILLIAISLTIPSCSEDEPVQIALYLPIANFSYEAFEKKVVFTDKSENADSYYWTFGDGETSTEQNPTHFFKANKKFTVELTITGERGKTSSKKMTVDLSDGSPDPTDDVNITLDGNFSDWAAVPSTMLATSSLASHVTDLVALKQVKFCGNSDYVFFYIKADASKFNVVQFYIDKDNSSEESGFLGWYWTGIGSEYLLEAAKEDELAPTIFGYDDANGKGGTEWAWLELRAPTQLPKAIEISNFVAGENNIVEVEGRMIRTYLPELGRTVKIGVSAMDADWAASGLLPSKLEDGGLNSAITVKLP